MRRWTRISGGDPTVARKEQLVLVESVRRRILKDEEFKERIPDGSADGYDASWKPFDALKFAKKQASRV